MKKIACIIFLSLIGGCTDTYFEDYYSSADYYRDKIRAETLERERKEAEAIKPFKKYVEDHSTEKVKKLVEEGKIALGMNKQEVIASIGRPNDINKTVGIWGVHEQWIYGDRRYLYFENGILTAWQE